MLTNDDIKKLEKTLASKEDLQVLKKEIITDGLSVFATKEDIKGIEARLDTLEEIVRNLSNSVEKFVAAVDDIKQEYLIMNRKTDLHEKWIKQIAGKVGVQLEY